MTESNEIPSMTAPTQDIEALAPLDIEATGDITDGEVTIQAKLPRAEIIVKYTNIDEGHLHLDTLFAAFPDVLNEVLAAIIREQFKENA